MRLTDPPASIPENWIMCKTARRFRAAVTSALGTGQECPYMATDIDEVLETRKVVERKDGTAGYGEWYVLPSYELWRRGLKSSPSLLGELTDLGRQVRLCRENIDYCLLLLW